ncbi:uncharacterized protein AB675_4977 [Cyphellophora attinorum]|uniref:Uncharacterized protein n=1 Tax=Cyphellophora attinorum TaxID=1664694 RepID=A0A0N1NY50_9EURO|nr:uncharacterized protein AB675_4977 [Phialophora attinorum]KPI39230.1 hypothetical protein AB675_4977 [Phialophora attinorum]
MPPKLEIEDSTADTEIFDLTAESPDKTPVRLPRGHDGMTVPSSQTPDSITRSARRSSARRPLAELSTNLQAAPSPPAVYTQSPFGKYTRKALKKPARPPTCPTVEDSQSNLWSLKATSPIAQQNSANKESDVLGSSPPLLVTGAALEGFEIPSTSQNNPSHSVASEQVPADTNGRKASVEAEPPGPVLDCPQVSEEGQVVVDVAEGRVDARAVEDNGNPVPVPRTKELELSDLSSQYVRMAVNFAVPDEDEADSDFGSPIRNDTQFNHDVKERTSSPLPTPSRPASAGHDTATKPLAVSHASPAILPQPTLQQNGSGTSTESLALPPPPPPREAATGSRGYVTSRVPLNDTAPSSSPPVQLTNTNTKSTTQRSVRPASMAHPSQISTQEATQYTGYGESSFEPLETPRAPQRVTIKDSSSIRRSISQVPQHVTSQPEFNIDLELGAADDAEQEEVQGNDEEYDLDPPSSGVVPAPDLPGGGEKLPVVPANPVSTEKLDSSSPSPPASPVAVALGPTQTRLGQEHHGVGAIERHKHGRSTSWGGGRTQDLHFESGASPRQARSSPRPAPRTVPGKKLSPARKHIAPKLPVDSTRISPSTTKKKQSSSKISKRAPLPIENAPSSPLLHSRSSSPPEGALDQLKKPLNEYTQLEGYNNETQSNFTQGGHVSAAYIHRQREKGLLPPGWTPKCFKVPGFTRR